MHQKDRIPSKHYRNETTESIGVGQSPENPLFRNRISMREKRWSQQQQQPIEISQQSSSESSPASPIITKVENAHTEGSPDNLMKQMKFFSDEVQMHKDAYEKVSKYYPPNPILPKSFLVHDDSPRSGGELAYIKLLKFRGKDFGRSKFEIERGVNQIEFTEGVTLKSIFSPPPDSTDERKTDFGEIVYLRSALDFSSKNHQPGNRKDEVLEENLIDVRRILKNCQTVQNPGGANQGQVGGGAGKKGLINLQGVDTFYKKKDSVDKTLIFESRFESGNLAAALKVNDNDYHLLLQNDVNTSGHTQWFFFRVQNTRKFQQVRFNMLNLSKPDSLFNEGMKVLVYSEKQSEEKDIGWHRSGNKISYYHNGIKKDSQKKSASGGNAKTLFTHTFTYEFLYDDDTVYFAYCYPYNYSDLLDDLSRISSDPIKSQFCARKTLCMSLAGNKVEMLTITSKNNMENMNKRKGVFLTSRVHPGESVGSWMMKGAIDFLTDETSEEAETLRQNFVFKIIPMLNPDGVINGNYRCSLAGCDLNRRWKAPSKVLHPCIYYTKQLLQQFSKERELVVFCDFHGHSRRKNIFMYGCHNQQAPEETRLYPYLMSKICPFFSFNFSRFGNQKSKEATARIAMFNDIKIPAIYTMESSFCGMDEGPYANYHFSTDNLMQTGRDFVRTLLLFCYITLAPNLTQGILQQIMSLLDYQISQNDQRDMFNKDTEVNAMVQFTDKMKQLQTDKREITTKRIRKALLQVLRTTHDVGTDVESSSSAGSDRAPSEDNLGPEEMQMVLPSTVEDEAGGNKKKKGMPGNKKDQMGAGATLQPPVDTATSISPQRRKGTFAESAGNQLKKMQTKVKKQQPLKKDNSKSNIKNDEASERKEEDDENKIDGEQLNMYQNGVEVDDTVTHKKKRKRNVESRDAWTQTDRSDYMLIKYRQKQKLALQMAKSQKFTKEEQMLYEQALTYHKQQQLLLNKTQEGIKDGQGTLSTTQTNGFNQGKSSNKDHQSLLFAQGANGPKVLQLQQNLFTYPEPHAMAKHSSSVGQSATMYIKSGEKQMSLQQQDGSQMSGSSMNVSRNLNSAQSTHKNKKAKQNAMQQQLGVTGKGGSQIIFTQNGQVFQMINNQAIPIKTQYLTEQQIKQLQMLIDPKSKNQGILLQSHALPSLQGGVSGPNAVQTASSGSKRKTQSIGYTKISPQKGVNNLGDDGQGLYQNIQKDGSELTSQHSTQRIIKPKISFKGSANQIPLESGAPLNNLIVLPTNQQSTSQRSSQGQFSQHHQHAPNRRLTANVAHPDGTELLEQVNEIQAATSVPTVLENAYIQKRLLQQQQQQQLLLQSYTIDQALIDTKQFLGDNDNYFKNLEVVNPPGYILSQNSLQETDGKAGGTSGRKRTQGEFYNASAGGVAQTANNALLKKMIEKQWQAQQQQQQQQQSLYSQGGGNNTGGGSASPVKKGRKTVSTKNSLLSKQIFESSPASNGNPQSFSSGIGLQQLRQAQNVANIIPHFTPPQFGILQGSPYKGGIITTGQSGSSNGQGVKISIVNVHNQFNIHNNIIINNPQPGVQSAPQGNVSSKYQQQQTSSTGQFPFSQSSVPLKTQQHHQQHSYVTVTSANNLSNEVAGGLGQGLKANTSATVTQQSLSPNKKLK